MPIGYIKISGCQLVSICWLWLHSQRRTAFQLCAHSFVPSYPSMGSAATLPVKLYMGLPNMADFISIIFI
eukprot:7246370-Ditylum_brightwellii.AAC.1